VLLPLFALTALLIKLVSPGPALFCQERVGFMGRRFKCLKFRTMHVHADQKTHQAHFGSLMKSDTPMVKLDARKDQRIIPFGRLLRATAIDELPQIFNVLKGDMSLIGPRPCIPYEYENYSRWQRQRVDTVPGMTGFWQVNGKNRTTFTEMMRMDIRYGRRKSLFLDLGIILKTIPAIWTQVADMVKPRIDKRDPDPA
jgi:lipopolysaccharide/colanic/teichoic acid biosynthesis glycosyltransferase